MGAAAPRFRGAVFLFLSGNIVDFDSADKGDDRWLWSGKSLAGADNGSPRIRDGQENGGGIAPIGQLPHSAT